MASSGPSPGPILLNSAPDKDGPIPLKNVWESWISSTLFKKVGERVDVGPAPDDGLVEDKLIIPGTAGEVVIVQPAIQPIVAVAAAQRIRAHRH